MVLKSQIENATVVVVEGVFEFFLTIFFEDGQIFLIYVDNSKLISVDSKRARPSKHRPPCSQLRVADGHGGIEGVIAALPSWYLRLHSKLSSVCQDYRAGGWRQI